MSPLMCFTRSDAIAVKWSFRWHLRAFTDRFFLCDLSIESGPEATCSLLVHFGSGGNTINGHEEELLRPYLAIQVLNVIENLNEHLVLCHAKSRGVGLGMSAIMDDAVHIQVKTVEFRNPVFCNELRDSRVSLAQPSKELWHTHSEGIYITVGEEAVRYCLVVEGGCGRTVALERNRIVIDGFYDHQANTSVPHQRMPCRRTVLYAKEVSSKVGVLGQSANGLVKI